MKLRASTKIALGFVVLAAVGYAGYQGYAHYRVDRLEFAPIVPGESNLVAIDPGSGYRIVVSNNIAQLVEGGAGEFDSTAGNDSGGANPKRIPLDELLKTLQGDTEALSDLVITLNDIDTDDLPPTPKYWNAEDIRAAIDGDAELQTQLEQDIACTLDGQPLGTFTTRSIVDGIVIRCPVMVEVRIEGEVQELEARIPVGYTSRLASTVWNDVRELSSIDQRTLAGYYKQAADEILAGDQEPEDVRRSLESLIAPSRLQENAAAPEKVLVNTTILINDEQMTGATAREYKGPRGQTLNDVTIKLTDEGRLRLWKYSRQHKGGQLLLIVNGVAIAAPRMSGELAQRSVTISQLPDPAMVREALDSINQEGPKGER